MEELAQLWKKCTIVVIYQEGDKPDCSNYRGISLLPATNKILSNIFVSQLTPYVNEIIGDDQCGFRRHISTTDLIFCFRQLL
jgi:hypothetical protein